VLTQITEFAEGLNRCARQQNVKLENTLSWLISQYSGVRVWEIVRFAPKDEPVVRELIKTVAEEPGNGIDLVWFWLCLKRMAQRLWEVAR